MMYFQSELKAANKWIQRQLKNNGPYADGIQKTEKLLKKNNYIDSLAESNCNPFDYNYSLLTNYDLDHNYDPPNLQGSLKKQLDEIAIIKAETDIPTGIWFAANNQDNGGNTIAGAVGKNPYLYSVYINSPKSVNNWLDNDFSNGRVGLPFAANDSSGDHVIFPHFYKPFTPTERKSLYNNFIVALQDHPSYKKTIGNSYNQIVPSVTNNTTSKLGAYYKTLETPSNRFLQKCENDLKLPIDNQTLNTVAQDEETGKSLIQKDNKIFNPLITKDGFSKINDEFAEDQPDLNLKKSDILAVNIFLNSDFHAENKLSDFYYSLTKLDEYKAIQNKLSNLLSTEINDLNHDKITPKDFHQDSLAYLHAAIDDNNTDYISREVRSKLPALKSDKNIAQTKHFNTIAKDIGNIENQMENFSANQNNLLTNKEKQIATPSTTDQFILRKLQEDVIKNPADKDVVANYLQQGAQKPSYSNVTKQLESNFSTGLNALKRDPDYLGINNTPISNPKTPDMFNFALMNPIDQQLIEHFNTPHDNYEFNMTRQEYNNPYLNDLYNTEVPADEGIQKILSKERNWVVNDTNLKQVQQSLINSNLDLGPLMNYQANNSANLRNDINNLKNNSNALKVANHISNDFINSVQNWANIQSDLKKLAHRMGQQPDKAPGGRNNNYEIDHDDFSNNLEKIIDGDANNLHQDQSQHDFYSNAMSFVNAAIDNNEIHNIKGKLQNLIVHSPNGHNPFDQKLKESLAKIQSYEVQEKQLNKLPLVDNLVRDDLEIEAINDPKISGSIADYFKGSDTKLTKSLELDVENGASFQQMGEDVNKIYHDSHPVKVNVDSQLLTRDGQERVEFEEQQNPDFKGINTRQLDKNNSQGDLSRAGLENEIKLQTSVMKANPIAHQYEQIPDAFNMPKINHIYTHITHHEEPIDVY